MNDSFLKRARSQYMHAKLLNSIQTGDEYTVNVVGYMLQQSVELLLKHILEMNGIRPPHLRMIYLIWLDVYVTVRISWGCPMTRLQKLS